MSNDIRRPRRDAPLVHICVPMCTCGKIKADHAEAGSRLDVRAGAKNRNEKEEAYRERGSTRAELE